MSLPVEDILAALESHALELGQFERVNLHEPKSAPGNGLTAAIWCDTIGPMPLASGLAITSGVLVFLVRIYQPMLFEPQDTIDPNVLIATDLLFEAYSGDFTLGAAVRNVDLLGQSGRALSAQAGYLNQDGKLYRVMTITVPIIINDLWPQEA